MDRSNEAELGPNEYWFRLSSRYGRRGSCVGAIRTWNNPGVTTVEVPTNLLRRELARSVLHKAIKGLHLQGRALAAREKRVLS